MNTYVEAENAEYLRLAAITETNRLAKLFHIALYSSGEFHEALMELSFEDRMSMVDRGWTRCPYATYKPALMGRQAAARVR